jgi:tetratricopeptide (TPR) repeat protein
MLSSFWGVFWVNVSNFTIAERSFLDIARKLHGTVETLEEAQQVIASTDHSWLLILDNADDPNFDYQTYFPPGTSGIILMTSRNPDCSQYATLGSEYLEGLDPEEAVRLLLRTAKVPSDQWHFWHVQARVVADLLGSHPLALIQAGSYVGRGHCTLRQYPQVFQRHRKRLLQFRPQQARSRYEHIYATFDASAQVLESSSEQTAQDALQLLSILSMLSPEEMPIAIFEAAWQGAHNVSRYTVETDNVGIISQWHVSQLPPFIETEEEEWDSFRVVEASHLLISLALIVGNNQHGSMTMSIHALTHAWMRDRQNKQDQNQAWLSTGSIIALSDFHTDLWRVHERQLRPHIHSYLDQSGTMISSCGLQLMIVQIVVRCGWLLHQMRDDARLFNLLQSFFKQLSVSPTAPSKEWLSLYDLMARNLLNMGKIEEAVQLLEQMVKAQEQSLAEDHPDQLASQHELAVAYKANGQVREAVRLLEQVVKIREQSLAEDHPSRLTSQHALAVAYEANGQVREAVQLLEQVVKIREQSLAEDHPSRLTSQHALAGAYKANGQVREAVRLLEQVVKIREQSLAGEHPDRLASQHELAGAYQANGQVREAVRLLEQVVKIEEQSLAEDHPDRLASQHELARAYQANGQVREAVRLLEQVVKIQEQSLAEDHPSRLTSQHALAVAYEANGQVRDAVRLLEQVVKIREQSLAEDHPDRLKSQHALARMYKANGQVYDQYIGHGLDKA